MNIDVEIQDLLYRNDCVIIPGFGAFICTKKSAQLLENHNFIPPKKYLNFNPSIVSNDGLLVNYISETRTVSYDEALQIVQEVVEGWRNKLSLINRIYLLKIGNLILNNENFIEFIPEDTSNFLSSSFGLSPIISPIIEKNEKVEEKVVLVASKVLPLENTKVKIIDNLDKKRSNYWRFVAVFLLFFIVSSFIGLFIYNKNIENKTIAIENKVNKKIEKKINEATFTIPILTFNDFSVNSELKGIYYIVAGSFSKIENADKLKLHLEDKGFKSEIIYRSNKMYSVTYNNFSSEIEAENFRKNNQKNINSDAWILFEPN
jgi:hypothetical protein